MWCQASTREQDYLDYQYEVLERRKEIDNENNVEDNRVQYNKSSISKKRMTEILQISERRANKRLRRMRAAKAIELNIDEYREFDKVAPPPPRHSLETDHEVSGCTHQGQRILEHGSFTCMECGLVLANQLSVLNCDPTIVDAATPLYTLLGNAPNPLDRYNDNDDTKQFTNSSNWGTSAPYLGYKRLAYIRKILRDVWEELPRFPEEIVRIIREMEKQETFNEIDVKEKLRERNLYSFFVYWESIARTITRIRSKRINKTETVFTANDGGTWTKDNFVLLELNLVSFGTLFDIAVRTNQTDIIGTRHHIIDLRYVLKRIAISLHLPEIVERLRMPTKATLHTIEPIYERLVQYFPIEFPFREKTIQVITFLRHQHETWKK
jgi:hypothetical protein